LDIKLKNKDIRKLKAKLCFEFIVKLSISFLIVGIIFVVMIDGILNDFLSELVYSINANLYIWLLNNKNLVLLLGLFLTMIIVVYKFSSKYVNIIASIYNSLDKVLKEDSDSIKLPNEVNMFSEKLNEIKYDYIITKKSQIDAEAKKNDLIMYMAHDLKTPLTSTIGYLNLINEEKDLSTEAKEKYIKIALEKAIRVEDLTNQFFEITRYNLQDMQIHKKNIDLSILIDQLVDECYPMLQDRNLKCKVTKPEHIYYSCDGDKIARCFGNLLKNAISYSYEKSEIEINVNETEEKIEIVFRNKGDKIPQYKLDKIFEKFYRADESRQSSTGGTGLGLAISKEIIELHKGKIYAKNEDEYIEFYIELMK